MYACARSILPAATARLVRIPLSTVTLYSNSWAKDKNRLASTHHQNAQLQTGDKHIGARFHLLPSLNDTMLTMCSVPVS